MRERLGGGAISVSSAKLLIADDPDGIVATAGSGNEHSTREYEPARWRVMPSDFPVLPSPTSDVLLERWRSVALVTGPNGALGSGFLISHDLFLTNHHVIPSPEVAARTQMNFHLERYPAGMYGPVIEAIRPLEGGWFHTSPFNQAGTNRHALDYTIIQLSYAPPVVTPISLRQATVRTGSKATLIHHPHGGPKRMDDGRIDDVSDLVVRYTTNDAPGSSGSPLINDNLDLITLHNGHGQGIRISALLNDLYEHAPKNLYRL